MDSMNPTLSAQQRKNKIDNFFVELVQFIEMLQKNTEIDVNCLTSVEELRECTSKQLLSHENIYNHVQEIASYLHNAFQSSLQPQLLSYWNCWAEIIKNSNLEYVNIRTTTYQYTSHIQEVDVMYQELYRQHSEKNSTALYATFYIHIVTVEKIEYALQKDLQKYSNDIVCFDIEQMFSLGSKVKYGSGYVTRGRAIRDALAHKKFRIRDHDGQKYIIFENTTDKYDFQEQLTVDEFLTYVRGSNMLYRMMYIMQSLMLLSTLLHESLNSD